MRVAYHHHLVGLIADVAVAAERLAMVEPERVAAVAAAARPRWARLSARLDGCALDEATADAVDSGWRPDLPADMVTARGWAAALRIGDAEQRRWTQSLAAAEYANLLDVGATEATLAANLFDDPAATLTELNRALVVGLAQPQAAGALRTTAQAVHDGAQGRALYRAPEPPQLRGLFDELMRWLAHDSDALPAAVVAGTLHQRLLEWLPFEGANGRTARSAARLVLRARGVDPRGAAVLEDDLAQDAVGYHADVAATIRRRGDLGPWLERHTQALLAGLRTALRACDPAAIAPPPDRALAVLDELAEDETITLPDYAERADVSRRAARSDLDALAAAGFIRPEPGSRGLRYRRPSSYWTRINVS